MPRQINKIDIDLALNEELCELLGAFIGDGFFGRYGSVYQVQFTGDKVLDKSYHYYLLKQIKELFPELKPKIIENKVSNSRRINIYSKDLCDFLENRFGFTPGVKCYSVKIPKEILNSGNKYLYSTIRGIFDTDGGITIDNRKMYLKPYGRIEFVTVSKKLFEQLVKILSKEFSLYTRTFRDKRSYTLTHRIVIYGNKQIERWMQLIGFSNTRHLNKINSLLKPSEGFEPPTCALQERCSSH
jgi:hypothetical protein